MKKSTIFWIIVLAVAVIAFGVAWYMERQARAKAQAERDDAENAGRLAAAAAAAAAANAVSTAAAAEAIAPTLTGGQADQSGAYTTPGIVPGKDVISDPNSPAIAARRAIVI